MNVASPNSRRAANPRLRARDSMLRFSAEVTLLRSATPRSSACAMSGAVGRAEPPALPGVSNDDGEIPAAGSVDIDGERETPTILSPSPSAASAMKANSREGSMTVQRSSSVGIGWRPDSKRR